ncbi:MAG: T9SS type A sorting domain-containing protein [Bacteroidota bacterium]|nr:T9SS type A sorting domain-containing protein [Bacteroidota bacterium]
MHYFFAVIFCFQGLFAWGGVAHRYINKNATAHLPKSMQVFIDQAQFFNDRAMDPDNRRSNTDTNFYAERYIHFLDIDDYPNFNLWLQRDLDSLIAKYGYQKVKENGTVPWVIKFYMDSLTAQLKRGDWTKSYQTANDLGHYVADSHVPVHATKNYNGQFSSQIGIHSRYESQMITNYQGQLSIKKDSVTYIDNVLKFSMGFIIHSITMLDSLLLADKYAAPPNGYNDVSGAPALPPDYYSKMWEKTNSFTKAQIQSATINLANLWYTAWVNAGLLSKPSAVEKIHSAKPESFNLQQNFPNPFNPKTTIQFEVATGGNVKLSILSLDGKEIASLVDSNLEHGSYSVDWNAESFSSGVYFYRIEIHQTNGGQAKNFSQTKKLVYLK